MDFGHAEECATKRKTIRTAFKEGENSVPRISRMLSFFFKSALLHWGWARKELN